MKKQQLLVVTFLISLSICLFASSQVVKAAGSLTVSVPTLSPVSPITLGGSVTANVIVGGIGGTPTGTITFQYSTDSGATWNALGANKTLSKGSATSDSYTPNAVGSNYRIRAVYSGDNKFDGATGNGASLTVNKANPTAPAPSVSSNPVVVNNTVTVSVTISGFSGGATPTGTATFQVKIGTGSWITIGSAVSLSSGLASTTYVPPTVGGYQFQVVYSGDSNYNGATGSAVSVTVYFAPLDHFVFSSVGTQAAGTSFSITIMAKDASNNTLTNYVGTNTLNVSTGTISPITTGGFSSGIWTGSVTVTGADSGVTLLTTGSGMSGTSSVFTVNPGALNSFTFATISSPQIDGSVFSITVMAKDVYGNSVTGYVGSPSLMVSAGSISPGTMDAFVNGVGSSSVTVAASGSDVNITVTYGSHSGTSNSFTVTNAPTPEPTTTSTPTQTSTPMSTPKPTNTPKPTAKPSPSPTPLETTIKAKTDNGTTVNLTVKGNITSTQISNVTIATNQSATSTTVSFTVTGESGTTGYSIVTIPKTAILYGTTPVVFIDGQQVTNQSYTQDPENFYVWYTTQFSTHQIKILFAGLLTAQTASFVNALAVGLIVPEIVLIYAVVAVKRLRRRPENT